MTHAASFRKPSITVYKSSTESRLSKTRCYNDLDGILISFINAILSRTSLSLFVQTLINYLPGFISKQQYQLLLGLWEWHQKSSSKSSYLLKCFVIHLHKILCVSYALLSLSRFHSLCPVSVLISKPSFLIICLFLKLHVFCLFSGSLKLFHCLHVQFTWLLLQVSILHPRGDCPAFAAILHSLYYITSQ